MNAKIIYAIDIKVNCHYISMKPLLRNLTRFVETALELYAPLPFEFTADLHTLNAYLRSYSQGEDKLLEGFVNRLVQKLEEKMKSLYVKQTQPTCGSESFDNALKHYNSCTFKYPELKLNLEADDLNLTQHLEREKPIYSQRSDRSDEGAIKRNRQKFGNKNCNKLNDRKDSQRDISLDKENLSINFNSLKDISQDKTLKGIKSEVELPTFDPNRKKSVDVSLKDKKEESKNKMRYESNQSRGNNNGSLKIKLKPKATIDLGRIKQAIDQTLQLFQAQDQEIMSLIDSLFPSEETSIF